MKTPEQMAEEYAEEKSRADYIGSDGERKWYRSGRGSFSREDFLAGYEAAKKQSGDFSKNASEDLSLEERIEALEQYMNVAQRKIIELQKVVMDLVTLEWEGE